MKPLKFISIFLCVAGILTAAVYYIVFILPHGNVGPVIDVPEETYEVSVSATDEELLQGVTATDAEDGDVTSGLMVESISNFNSDLTRTVNIVAFDQDNNVAHAKRTIAYTDYTHPHFSLRRPLQFSLNTTAEITGLMTVSDVLDGNITERLLTYNTEGSTLDKTTAGDYPVYYSVTNSAGDTVGFTATVTMIDKTRTIAAEVILSDWMVYIKKGDTFNPTDYIYSLYENQITYYKNASDAGKVYSDDNKYTISDLNINIKNLVLDNPVDTDTPGWYEVTYGLSNVYDDMIKTHLLVCVEE